MDFCQKVRESGDSGKMLSRRNKGLKANNLSNVVKL